MIEQPLDAKFFESMEIFQLAKVIKKFGKLNDEEQLLLMYILEIYEEIKNEKASSN